VEKALRLVVLWRDEEGAERERRDTQKEREKWRRRGWSQDDGPAPSSIPVRFV
jgi:hypothetical protein